MLKEYLSTLANAMRSKLGSTDKINAQDFVDKIGEVYDAGYTQADQDNYPKRVEAFNNGLAEGIEQGIEQGKQAEYDHFWDNYQQNGNRTQYSRAFCDCWDDENFFPKYDMLCLTAGFMFSYSKMTNLKERLKECNVIVDFSQCTAFQQTFQGCETYAIPTIDMRKATSSNYTFQGCHKTYEIEKIIVSENTVFMAQTFGMNNIEKITFEGVIGQNGLNFQWSTKLTVESLRSIISCLKDYSQDTSGTQWVVTVGSTNLAKLTDSEKAIATQKGWTLA